MKIKDRYTHFMDNGTFFTPLIGRFTWLTSETEPALSLLFMSRYREREESPLTEICADSTDTREAFNAITATCVYQQFASKWGRLWAAAQAAYDPIQNYNMEEAESVERSHTEDTDTTDVLGRTGTETTQSNGSEQVSVYGFNGSTPAPSDDTDTDRTETLTLGTEDNRVVTTEKEGGENESRTLTRSGNIGVTTTQQMLQQEIELWRWNFYENIMEDAASILTTPLYTL